MFSPFVRKKLRDISQKPSTIQRTFFCRFLSIGEEKMSPLSKKRGHHDLRILRFERIASTAAVRTRGDFGIIPSPDDIDAERKMRSKRGTFNWRL